jgi:hypothetical protein
MRAKEIVLLVLVIAAGILLYQERTGKIGFGWRPGDFIFLDGEAFTFQETQVLEVPAPASLRLLNAHGAVEIQGAETDKITVTFEKKIRRHRETEAKEVAAELHLRVEKNGAALVIGTNRDEFRRRNFETNLRLTVPAATAVEVVNSHGPVTVRGLMAAVIANSHGEVTASAIAGGLKVDNSYEDVTVDGVRSRCEIRSTHADVSARNVEGGLKVDQSYGFARLQKIGQRLDLDGPHTEVVAEDVTGPVDIQNSYEKVTLRRVGPAKVTGHHSDVEATQVDGGLEVATSYASVDADSVRGGLRVSGKSVSVTGEAISPGEISVSTSYEPVTLSGFSGKATILVSHGGVTLTPLALSGPLEVRGSYSPIILHWPAGGPYPIEAQCRSGRIHWRITPEARVEEKDGTEEVKAFSGFADKPTIRLVTSYDNIDVEEN